MTVDFSPHRAQVMKSGPRHLKLTGGTKSLRNSRSQTPSMEVAEFYRILDCRLAEHCEPPEWFVGRVIETMEL